MLDVVVDRHLEKLKACLRSPVSLFGSSPEEGVLISRVYPLATVVFNPLGALSS